MKILKNATVTKLKEYSRSYGPAHTINVDFIIEYENQIILLTKTGAAYRSLKKGTKLLISFTGTEITERAFKMACKNMASAIKMANLRAEEERIKQEYRNDVADKQLKQWIEFLKANPDKIEKYKNKVAASPSNSSRSGNWRNWLRMKAAKHINSGQFNGLEVSAPELMDTLQHL